MKSSISKRLIIILVIIACIIGVIVIIGANKDNETEAIPTAYNSLVEIPFQALLAKGDAVGLGQYFAPEVSIAVPGKDEDLPKAAAVKVLTKFFFDNPPQSFELRHNGLSPKGEGKFHIGQLKTKNGSFRTTLMIQKELIQELRFEKE